ncbi:unnamed protein product [Enterobius vermicularis]|uniref:Uncharacterized protein n=1 Tax=Enterobius vermicularis TaxID=51028 RepID=A0A0N4USV6_ENTVE|nr:unnamed protein product [Enterobius vermicularis]
MPHTTLLHTSSSRYQSSPRQAAKHYLQFYQRLSISFIEGISTGVPVFHVRTGVADGWLIGPRGVERSGDLLITLSLWWGGVIAGFFTLWDIRDSKLCCLTGFLAVSLHGELWLCLLLFLTL